MQVLMSVQTAIIFLYVIGFCNRARMCLLRGPNLIFKCNSGS